MIKFELIMIWYELTEPQEHTITSFIGGLRKGIANFIELQPYIFLDDVIKLVTIVERQKKKKFSNWNNSSECFKIYFHIFTNMECT